VPKIFNKLSLIFESLEDKKLLSGQANFETLLLYEPELKSMSNDEALDYFTKQFTTNPSPGVSPINAKVIKINEVDEDGLVKVIFRTSIEEFIRNSIEYGIDPYEILNSIKKFTGNQAIVAAANRFMRDKSNNFKVAKIGQDGHEVESNVDVNQQF
jgi:hypothetical protein